MWQHNNSDGNNIRSDQTAPQLSAIPESITVECDGIPTTGIVSATDNCDADVAVLFEEIEQAGNCSDAYTIIRSWTATDNCGNETVGTQSISVMDNTAPVLDQDAKDLTVECDGSGNTADLNTCLLYTSPSPRDLSTSRMPSSA